MTGPVEGSAQSFEVVHAFATLPREPSGRLLQLADGYFLGTSRRGGVFDKGTIYLLYRRADATWNTFVIHSFFGPEGRQPFAGVMRASDGNFYGTTRRGGAHDEGVVFRMTPAGRVSLLHSFSGADGGGAEEPLIEAPDGSLWSTAQHGGPGYPSFYGHGTVFRITKAGSLTTMHAFNGTDGTYPNALVAGPDGFFYGSTQSGGPNPTAVFRSGTVFRIATTGVLTTVAAFEHDFLSSDLTVGADGDLYGTSERGWVEGSEPPPGGNTFGLAFRVTRTGVVTALHYFVPEDGFVMPSGGLVQGRDGFLYGGTSSGFVNGSADHTGAAMFRLSSDGQVHKVADLGGSLGSQPSGLMLAQDGRLYGTTRIGGVPAIRSADDGFGSVFAIGRSEPAALLFPFSHPTPLRPAGRLAEGPGGALFGTSCGGGTYGRGTVFMLSGGLVTTLHSFTGRDGECPLAGLTLGPNGVFYGTTVGSIFGEQWGTVFSITPAGTHTTLWSAGTQSTPGSGPPGTFPAAAPTLGPDGNLYVTTSSLYNGSFGLENAGAVLRVSLDGAVDAIAAFDPNAGYGYWPFGPLTLASDGHFYGTTTAGAGNGIYRMSLAGMPTNVSTFSADPSGRPNLRAGLVQGADGRLYGSGLKDGPAGAGVLFAATTLGEVAVLHEFSFSGTGGYFPYGELVEHAPGRFIGMTVGSSNVYDWQFGTVFEVTANGGFSTLRRFSWLDGANPLAGFLRTTTGQLYGTTSEGGLGGGVIFRLVAPTAPSTR